MKGRYCTYMHCQGEYGDRVRDWEKEGHKVEFCRYHYGLGNYSQFSCNKGQDCKWAHSEWDMWSRGKLKTKDKNMWNKVVDKCLDDHDDEKKKKKKPSYGQQPQQSRERRRVLMAGTRHDGENKSANIAKALEDGAKAPANITGREISATHGASSLPQSKEGEGPKNDSAESMQEEVMQTLEETVKGMRSKELTLLWRDNNKLSCGIGHHQCDPTPTTLPPLTTGRQLEAGLMNKEEAGEKESQAEEGAAAAEVITETASPNNVQQAALRREDALKEVVEKEDYGEEEKVTSDTGLELKRFTVKLFNDMWYGKEGPQEAATKVAGLEAEEGAVVVAATEEEATRQSPSS